MPTKKLRDLVQAATDMGLTVISIENRRKHHAIRLLNAAGVEVIHTLSKGKDVNRRDHLNDIANLRRHARGQTHGLRVASKPA